MSPEWEVYDGVWSLADLRFLYCLTAFFFTVNILTVLSLRCRPCNAAFYGSGSASLCKSHAARDACSRASASRIPDFLLVFSSLELPSSSSWRRLLFSFASRVLKRERVSSTTNSSNNNIRRCFFRARCVARVHVGSIRLWLCPPSSLRRPAASGARAGLRQELSTMPIDLFAQK